MKSKKENRLLNLAGKLAKAEAVRLYLPQWHS